MQKIDIVHAASRVRSIEKEFIDFVCDEVGLSRQEIHCLSNVNRVSRKTPRRIETVMHIAMSVNNQGNKAELDVKFNPGEPGAKDAAKQSMADKIYNRLSSQAVDLRSITH